MSLARASGSAKSSLYIDENHGLNQIINKEFSADVKRIFTEHNINEVRGIEKGIRKDISNLTAEVHGVICENFAKWLEAADSTKNLNLKIKSATERLLELRNTLELRKTAFGSAKGTVASEESLQASKILNASSKNSLLYKPKAKENYHKEELCRIAAEIKVLTDTNEQIWQDLDSKNFLHAAIVYMRAQKIYTDLTSDIKNKSLGSLEAQFPVIEQQWAIIARLHNQITSKCSEYLNQDLIGRDIHLVASAICGLVLLDKYKLDQACDLYLTKLYRNLEITMAEFYNSMGNISQPDLLAYTFTKNSVGAVQKAIVQFSQLFFGFSQNSFDSASKEKKTTSLIIQLLNGYIIKDSSSELDMHKSYHGESDSNSKPESPQSIAGDNNPKPCANDSKNGLVGWAARRRSSLFGAQTVFYTEDSSPSTGYTVSKFLPESIRFFCPDLSFLDDDSTLQPSNQKNAEGESENRNLNQKTQYVTQLRVTEKLTHSIADKFTKWFDLTLDILKRYISAILKSCEVPVNQIVTIANKLVKYSCSEQNSTFILSENGIPNHSVWNAVCENLTSVTGFISIPKIDRIAQLQKYKNLYLTELLPYFDNFVKEIASSTLLEAAYSAPMACVQSWIDPSKFLSYNDTSIDHIAWHSLILDGRIRHIRNLSRSHSEDTGSNDKVSFADLEKLEHEISQSLSPVLEEVKVTTNQIFEQAVKSLEDTLNWNSSLMEIYLAHNIKDGVLDWANIGNFDMLLSLLLKVVLNLCSTIEENADTQLEQCYDNFLNGVTKDRAHSGLELDLRSKLNTKESYNMILLGHFGISMISLLENSKLQALLIKNTNFKQKFENMSEIDNGVKSEHSTREGFTTQILEMVSMLRKSCEACFGVFAEYWARSFVSNISGSFTNMYGFFCEGQCRFKELTDEKYNSADTYNETSYDIRSAKAKKRQLLKKATSSYLSSLSKPSAGTGFGLLFDQEPGNTPSNSFVELKATVKSVLKLKNGGAAAATFSPSSQLVDFVLDMVYQIHSKMFLYSAASNNIFEKVLASLAKKIADSLDSEIPQLLAQQPVDCLISQVHDISLLVNDLVYTSCLLELLGIGLYEQSVPLSENAIPGYTDTTSLRVLQPILPETCKALDRVLLRVNKSAQEAVVATLQSAEQYTKDIREYSWSNRIKGNSSGLSRLDQPRKSVNFIPGPFDRHFAVIATLLKE